MKQETFNAVINYLLSKPYQEVAQLIQMITKDIEEQQASKEHEGNAD